MTSARGNQGAPWLPLIVILLAQLQMAMNISALPVSLGPIAEDLHAPATAAATALLLYSLFVAAFVMLGAKIGKLLGERRVLQASVVVHAVAMGLMATSTDVSTMNTAQAIAGVAAAALVPTLVVLIAANYHGRQQASALGVLAGIPAVASALTFVIAGFLATALSWRYSYGLIVALAVVVLALSNRLQPIPRQRNIRIDLVGVVLSAAAIALTLFGFSNLQSWGPLAARAEAPFSLLGCRQRRCSSLRESCSVKGLSRGPTGASPPTSNPCSRWRSWRAPRRRARSSRFSSRAALV